MYFGVPIDIRFVGPPVPSFLPRWRCDDAPLLQAIVGCPLAVQQALASTASATPQLAVVIGRSGVVEGADLVVRVDDLREARRACGVLVSLATPRRDSLLDTSPCDLATIVRSGRGGDGLLLRRRGGSLVDASRQVGIPVVGARPHAMLVRSTTNSHPGALADHFEAMRLLGDIDDQLDTFFLGLRDPSTTVVSTIELLAAVRRPPSVAEDVDLVH